MMLVWAAGKIILWSQSGDWGEEEGRGKGRVEGGMEDTHTDFKHFNTRRRKEREREREREREEREREREREEILHVLIL